MSIVGDQVPGGGVASGGRRRLSVGEAVAWVVILLSVAVVVGLPLIVGKAPAAKAHEASPGVELLLQARNLVGIHALPEMKESSDIPRLFKSIEKSAHSPQDQFRVVILRGELDGKPAALADLRGLEKKYPSLGPDAQVLEGIYAGKPPEDSARWRAFKAQEGWFADLAASTGKGPGDPVRQATIAAAQRTAVESVGGMLAVIGAGCVGFVLMILGFILYAHDRLAPAFGLAPGMPMDRRAYVQAFACYLGIYVGGSLVIKLALSLAGREGWGLWAAIALPVAFLVGIFWPIWRGQSWRQWRMALGLHAGRGFFREVGAGALGYIAGLPLLALGLLLAGVLMRVSGVDASHPITQDMTGSGWEIFLIFLLASIYAPITEELMFRGALFAHMRERFGFWISALSVSVVFIIIHPQAWPALPPLLCIALILASIREWRGSIWGCMTAHAINNTAVMVMLVVALS